MFDDVNADYFEVAKLLTNRIAVNDPDFVKGLSTEWNDDISIPFSEEYQNNLYSAVKDYKGFTDRTFLISKRKHYILINLLARMMLSKGANHFGFLGLFPIEFFRERLIDYAYILIVDMYQEWMGKKDLSLIIPEDLDQGKKQIIDSYLQTIRSLDIENETENNI